MKKTFILALSMLSISMIEAQNFGFGGEQKMEITAQFSEKFNDLNYAGDNKAQHTLDVYLPKTPMPKEGYPVIVHIYGSAWFSNNSKGMADINTICAALLDAGYAIVCPNHCSSGDAKYPEQINDIKAVIRWIRGNSHRYHFDTRFIGTSGFSSGAHLASLCAATNGVGVATKGQASYDIEGKLGQYTDQSSYVNACCEWSGPIDLMNMDCNGDLNMPFKPEVALMGFDFPGHEEEYWLLSPVYYINKQTVPIMVNHGVKDNVVPYCQGEELYNALKDAGVKGSKYHSEPEGGHGFNMYSDENLARMVAHFNEAKEACFSSIGQPLTSPDGKTILTVNCENGKASYSLSYQGMTMLEASPLGLQTNVGDFTQELTLSQVSPISSVTDDYTLYNIKNSRNHYEAYTQTFTFSQGNARVLNVTFEVSNNNVAFRYQLLPKKETMCCIIDREATGFNLPAGTTTFLCPQMGSMTGFARTAPSYETHYEADGQMGKNGWGQGYVFPGLFKVAGKNWMLISETGVNGSYCASKLENIGEGQYVVSFPSMTENNGYGSTGVQAALPSYTPWRTITMGETLKPIVEGTITWNVLHDQHIERRNQVAAASKYGRGSWSWIIANDESCNYDTQKEYIDFSAAMGWESLLIDAMWDVQIGRDRIAELAQYGRQKGVNLYLWYNSNGQWNDAPQTPRNCMDTPAHRRAEMAWMKSIGIRGIKVDFFGGDKQCTMQLYENILRDAEEFGLMVIFHGCTLPRGWERMYPNFVACEAVRASENLHFNQSDCDREAMDATFLPFIRNAVGSMDFGGSTLNWYYNPKNSNEMWGGHRITSNVFALATAILFQSPVQHFAMAPNNLNDAPTWAVDFMKRVPTTWDEVQYIDGYPGKYVILARRTGDTWYVAGINAENKPLKVTLPLTMFAASTSLSVYSDDAQLNGGVKQIILNKKQTLEVSIPQNGGLVIKPSFNNVSSIVEGGGTGASPAVMMEVPGFEDHTVFLPQDLSKFNKKNPLPVLVWGNGACSNSPGGHYLFLNEIASQGYLVIATGFFPKNGEFYEGPMSTPEQQIASIDWAETQNNDPKSPLYGKIDIKAICAAGMSCGGLQTLYNCADPRITTYMICNSGLFIDPSVAMPNMPMPGKDQLKGIHGPIFYLLGGPDDIAYQNGMDDFHRISHVPAFAANYPVGHGGTYSKPHGGEYSIPAIAWLNWQLKGDKEAAKMFQGKDCKLAERPDWSVEKNELIDK